MTPSVGRDNWLVVFVVYGMTGDEPVCCSFACINKYEILKYGFMNCNCSVNDNDSSLYGNELSIINKMSL